MRLSRGLHGLLVVLGVSTGCSDPEACTAEARRAVEVEPHDGLSDEFIAVAARGVVRDGPFEDSLRVVRYIGSDPALPVALGAAEERPGTYAVHLQADGYVPWDTTGVQVASDGCHVRTAVLSPRLHRAP
jgi:hypothetical protein